MKKTFKGAMGIFSSVLAKSFFSLHKKINLKDRVGGAFGSSTHSGEAPKLIIDTAEFVFNMKMTNLGAFDLREIIVNTA